MAFNMIETPGIPNGDENQRIENIYRYLCRMADDLNIQLGKIGSNDLTDEERQIMMQVIRETSGPAAADAEITDGMAQMESLKSMIVKTAKFVQTKLQEYRTSLLRETVAEGQFGKYVRNTGLDVVVNPEGITQTFKFSEVVQGLRNFEVFAKNYIKTGLLREESSIPIYGLQIGKDIVTFSEDGTETYHDGNKALEVLADAINFFSGGNKVFYITSGKIHSAGDLEIESGGKLKVKSGGTFDVDSTNFKINSTNGTVESGDWVLSSNGIDFSKTGTYGTKKIHIGSEQLQNIGTDTVSQIVLGDTLYNHGGNVYTYAPSIELVFNSDDFGASKLLITQFLSNRLRISSSEKYDLSDVKTLYADTAYITDLHQGSSREIKHNIRPMELMGEKLDELKPVTFVYNNDEEERTRYGLIHEETVDVLPEICVGDKDAKAEDKGINYVELVPILLKEIQDLRKRVAALEQGGREE